MIKKIISTPWPSVLWTIAIFVLLTISGSSLPSEPTFRIPNFDKLVHALIFGVFVLLWWKYLHPKWNINALPFIICIISIIYGIGMEYYQLLFTSREFEYADMLADGTGSILATIYCIRAKKSPYGNRGRNQN